MKSLLTIAIITLLGLQSFVQGQDSIPLPTQNVKVVKQFQPKATDAKAIELFPKDVKTPTLPKLNMKYDTPSIDFLVPDWL